MKTGYYKKDGEYHKCIILGKTDVQYANPPSHTGIIVIYPKYLIQIVKTTETIEVTGEDLFITND